jgi:hypothetical protein
MATPIFLSQSQTINGFFFRKSLIASNCSELRLKVYIVQLDNAGVKPVSMISTLRKEGIILQKQQLNNFLKNERKKKLGNKAFCLKDLIDYAESKLKVPVDITEVFVSDYNYKTEPRIEFRTFMTTKKLISFS